MTEDLKQRYCARHYDESIRPTTSKREADNYHQQPTAGGGGHQHKYCADGGIEDGTVVSTMAK